MKEEKYTKQDVNIEYWTGYILGFIIGFASAIILFTDIIK